MSGADGNEKENLIFSPTGRNYASIHLEFSFLDLFSNKLSGVSFADEDFQQPQFGFHVLVFVVLHCQRGAVLLLHISIGTGRQT